MRVVFLVGGDTASTRATIDAVCRLPGVEPVGVLKDTARPTIARRLRNLKRNLRREGWSYVVHRGLAAAREFTDALVDRVIVSAEDVHVLLREAFPERGFSLEDLGRKHRFAIHAAGNLNEAEAIGILRSLQADLGIVLGTRILKPAIFTVPRLGCINLHKGRVPDYRGMPPGFWELYDSVKEAGVTVHFVDAGLDTGDVVIVSKVAILPTDTPDSLLEKLHTEGTRAMTQAVAAIEAGTAVRQPQPKGTGKAHTKPTRREVRELQKKLPHWRVPGTAYTLFKNLYCLAAYYLGPYFLLRSLRRLSRSRGAVIVYHRVNDYSKDVLTVDTETFAAQLLALKKRYRRISTRELVANLHKNKAAPPTSIAIHFDDCYQDIYTNGAPILAAAGFPATAFINSGFIDTARVFDHDAAKYPFKYANLRSDDIREWVRQGFEVGAHSVNHLDLDTRAMEDAKREISDCGAALEKLTGKPVSYFSVPFGVKRIRDELVEHIRETGFEALFSANGGFVGPKTDPFDIPRLGSSGQMKPLYLLLEIEGIAPHHVVPKRKRKLSQARRFRRR